MHWFAKGLPIGADRRRSELGICAPIQVVFAPDIGADRRRKSAQIGAKNAAQIGAEWQRRSAPKWQRRSAHTFGAYRRRN